MFHALRTVVGDINRLRVIVQVLFEEGFGFVVARVQLMYLLPLTSRLCAVLRRCRVSPPETDTSTSWPERARVVCERLGPTFVKLAQLLSLRADIIPREYAESFRVLRSHVAPCSSEEIAGIMRQEFGMPPEELFREFDPESFAAGSLAQVHRARLADGTWVAVKIQRPQVRAVIENDIHILFFLASLAEKYVRELQHLQPVKLIKEFSTWTMRELDFKVEASNAERFRDNFAADGRFHIPRVYWDYTTTRVLTMELIEGAALDDLAAIRKAGDDPRVLALNGLEIGMRQFFVHGFFQADPHPGNFFALPGNVLCLHDFGMIGFLDRPTRDKLAAALLSFSEKNVDATMEKMLALAPDSSLAARERFISRATPLVSVWLYAKDGKKNLANIFDDLVREGVRAGMTFPENLALFSRALVSTAALVGLLYPEFDPHVEMPPLLSGVIQERFDPQRILKDFEVGMVEYVGFLQQLPAHTLKLIEKIEKGQIDVRIDRSEIMAIKQEMDRLNHIRLVSFMLVTLIVSAAIILRLDEQKLLFGLSVAKIQLLLAVVTGIWLLVLIRKR